MAYRFSPIAQFIPGATPVVDTGIDSLLAHVRDQKRIAIARDAEARAGRTLEENIRAAMAGEELRRAQQEEAARHNQVGEARNERAFRFKVEKDALAERKALRPEHERSLYEAAGLEVPGMAPTVGAHRVESDKSAMEMVDEALATPPGATPVEPPSDKPAWHQRGVESLQTQYRAILENPGSGPLAYAKREAAKAVIESAPSLLENYKGDTEKAAEAARRLFERMVTAEKKPPSLGGGGSAERPDLEAGQRMFQRIYKDTGANTLMVSWKAASQAQKMLEKDPNNESTLSAVAYQIARAMNGPGVLTNQDVQSVFGLDSVQSLMNKGEQWITSFLFDHRGDAQFMRNLMGMVGDMEKRSRELAFEAKGEIEGYLTEVGGIAPTGLGVSALGHARATFAPLIKEIARKDKAKKRFKEMADTYRKTGKVKVPEAESKKPKKNPIDDWLDSQGGE